MDSKHITARKGEKRYKICGIGHHKVRVEIYIAHFTHSGNNVVSVGYIVNENAVHNIYMKPLDLCVFGTVDFFFYICKVARKH